MVRTNTYVRCTYICLILPLYFSAEVRTKRGQMDKGIHIGSWGQLQGKWSSENNTTFSDTAIEQNGKWIWTPRLTLIVTFPI